MAEQQSAEGASTSDGSVSVADSTLEINIKTLDSQMYNFRVEKNFLRPFGVLTLAIHGVVFEVRSLFYWKVFVGGWVMVMTFWFGRMFGFLGVVVVWSQGLVLLRTRTYGFVSCWILIEESGILLLFNTFFSEEISSKILQIPLALNPVRYSRFWWPSKSGDYAVKSGYWLGHMGRFRVELGGLDEDSKETWRLVWGLGGPPKMGHFLWQACRGSMAVKEVLLRRHIATDDICGCCGQGVESIIHVLLSCPTAQAIWLQSEFSNLVEEAPADSFAARLRWLANKVSMG